MGRGDAEPEIRAAERASRRSTGTGTGAMRRRTRAKRVARKSAPSCGSLQTHLAPLSVASPVGEPHPTPPCLSLGRASRGEELDLCMGAGSSTRRRVAATESYATIKYAVHPAALETKSPEAGVDDQLYVAHRPVDMEDPAASARRVRKSSKVSRDREGAQAPSQPTTVEQRLTVRYLRRLSSERLKSLSRRSSTAFRRASATASGGDAERRRSSALLELIGNVRVRRASSRAEAA